MCSTSDMFSGILKHTEICHIFKKGDGMNACNYRPVRIVPIVFKIYNTVIILESLSTGTSRVITIHKP